MAFTHLIVKKKRYLVTPRWGKGKREGGLFRKLAFAHLIVKEMVLVTSRWGRGLFRNLAFMPLIVKKRY